MKQRNFQFNYAFYLFAAAFNWFFLLYVALFALSIYALIFGLVHNDGNRIGQKFRERTPVRWISGYMLFVAVGLTTMYITQSLNFIATGQLPEIVVKTGHPTSVIFTLDLSLLVLVFVSGAIWLWMRRPWGYVLSNDVNGQRDYLHAGVNRYFVMRGYCWCAESLG